MSKPHKLHNIKLYVTRDSICLGDDFDPPHEQLIHIHENIELHELINKLASNYLPRVNGVKHFWECFFNDQLIARIKNCSILFTTERVVFENENHTHFKYHSALT